MEIYSIGLATDCHLDGDFFELIEKAAFNKGLTTYNVNPHNIDETVFQILNHQIGFKTFYDRAADSSEQFLKLYKVFLY